MEFLPRAHLSSEPTELEYRNLRIAYDAACEGMVLLKNDGTLPLSPGSKICMFGSGTGEFLFGGGGSGQLVAKEAENAYEGAPVHFIGHLQTNKVNKVVGNVELIQSVDRPELLAAINKEAMKKGIKQDILLEVNIGNEESKSGYTPEGAMETAAQMADFPGVHLCGLMAIPPISQNPGDNRKYFAQMAKLYVDIAGKKYDNVNMVCLSMGMSDDFEDAIAEGSTMIRVGTAIFGARYYGTTAQK